MHSPDFRTSGGQVDSERRPSCTSWTQTCCVCADVQSWNVEGYNHWSQKTNCFTTPAWGAEDILDQPSEQRRAVQSHRQYARVSPHTSEKKAIEGKSWQHLALTCAPEGKRGGGGPRETWRKTIGKERNKLGWHSWGATATSALDCDGRHNLLAGVKSSHGPDEDKKCIQKKIGSAWLIVNTAHLAWADS